MLGSVHGLEKYICRENTQIVDAMKKIDLNGKSILYVVDSDGRLMGCLTDGDIRRWIIKHGSLNAEAYQAMNHSPIYITKRDECMANDVMHEKGINSIPIIEPDMYLIDVGFIKDDYPPLSDSYSNSLVNTPVIVMAGGKGTRLYPYTKILPKPLIPIGDIPILERILNKFALFGARNFYLVVNYKKEMIKSYFSENDYSFSLHFIDEREPLGTAGGICLINQVFTSPVIVTNCDILIEADYSDIINYHIQSENDMTIVSSLKNTVIPYGVINVRENGVVESMDEKPQLSHLINTGMYVVNPNCLDKIPVECVYHMTDLADQLIRDGNRVGVYPISEDSFLDMGQIEELKRMEERIK